MSVIEFAEKRLLASDERDASYWAAYLDGARAQKQEDEKAPPQRCGR